MTPTAKLSQVEFIALMAMLAATVAFAIDAMLPGLPLIAAELSPDAPNRVQLILTSFVLGMGVGTFFTGPLSDTFGRKPVMVAGAVVYIAAALMAWVAPSLELILLARFAQGLGAAGPRVVAMAMIRDMYSGRDMARIMSFVMIIFTLVPALAPTMGAVIMNAFGWRVIFLSFIAFTVLTALWLVLRQPETLAKPDRRPLHIASLFAALQEILLNRTTRLSIIVQTLSYGILFGMLSSTQQIFDVTFGQGETFHLWFGGIAVVSASASVLNARLVGRLGMRALIKGMFTVQIAMTSLMIVVTLGAGHPGIAFWMFLVWTTSIFFQAGMTIGNLNALAMEPMGHIAGMAASVIAAVATVGGVMLAAPIGLAFDGTPLPLAYAMLPMCVLAVWLTSRIQRPSDPR